jgi:hypothetical protein
MNATRRALWALAALGLPPALAGCGETHYEHARVHGTVTYDGKPMTKGSVLFVPVQTPPDGTLLPASGEIQPDGTYELLSAGEPGAVLGEHKVVIIAFEGGQKETETDLIKGPAPATPTSKKASSRLKALVPAKYTKPETTPLTRKVEPGENAINIEVTD